MDNLDVVEEIRYVQIHREVLGVNVNLDLLETRSNSALVYIINIVLFCNTFTTVI